LTSLRFGESSKTGAPPATIGPEKSALDDELINAAFNCDLATVKRTLDAGAHVNAVDEYGHTALMLAAESLRAYGKKDIIKTLLDRGADISIKDPRGWTAMEHFWAAASDVQNPQVGKGLQLLGAAEKEAERKGRWVYPT
jgi:hypothetical protein